jgi:hypothetical protein
MLLALASFSGAETNNPIVRFSEYLDYQLDVGTNGLSWAWLVLRPRPQSEEWSVYTDIDGDSVFDAMVHVTATNMASYVLFSNTWVQVGNMKSKFTVGEERRSPTGRRFIFRGHTWEALTRD